MPYTSDMFGGKCTDPVIGGILSGWRYDISGLAPEMRMDYETHLMECDHCAGKQTLHRRIDIGLVVISIIASGLFMTAFAAATYFHPKHALVLQIGAFLGFGLSVFLAVAVALATPAPVYVKEKAMVGARRIHDRLPEDIRERLPEELRTKLL